jgi:hypothetical protein
MRSAPGIDPLPRRASYLVAVRLAEQREGRRHATLCRVRQNPAASRRVNLSAASTSEIFARCPAPEGRRRLGWLLLAAFADEAVQVLELAEPGGQMLTLARRKQVGDGGHADAAASASRCHCR